MIDQFFQSVNFESLSTHIVAYLPNILSSGLLILLFWAINKISRRMVSTALLKTKISTEAQNLILRFVRYAVLVIAFVTVADQLGINVTSLIAGVGIAGLAISFAAQDTISNVISGIAIIIDRPFSQGDWISIGDMHASVTDIRLRTTVLTTFDNETVVVPNKQLAQERVVNYTLTPKIRVRVAIGIAYKEDTKKAREVLLKTLAGDNRILDDPAPAVLVKNLGGSSVDLELRFWTEDSIMKFTLMWEYIEKGKQALDRAGIEIPYPHLQLFLEQTEGLKLLAARDHA
ncbi:MAG: mechanosensitive ion channel family protein [Desulfobacterales bacterium]|jgi:small conductance mechanosensitive channel